MRPDEIQCVGISKMKSATTVRMTGFDVQLLSPSFSQYCKASISLRPQNTSCFHNLNWRHSLGVAILSHCSLELSSFASLSLGRISLSLSCYYNLLYHIPAISFIWERTFLEPGLKCAVYKRGFCDFSYRIVFDFIYSKYKPIVSHKKHVCEVGKSRCIQDAT